jgi:hypothetical protein
MLHAPLGAALDSFLRSSAIHDPHLTLSPFHFTNGLGWANTQNGHSLTNLSLSHNTRVFLCFLNPWVSQPSLPLPTTTFMKVMFGLKLVLLLTFFSYI